MNVLRVALLFFLLKTPFIVHSQIADTSESKKIGNTYIEKMDQYLGVKLSMNNDIKDLIVKNTSRYEIFANDKNVLKLSLNYRWLSGAFGFAPKFLPGNNDDDLKGKTKVGSFSLNFNFDHWIQNISYTRVKGFYLNNTADFDPTWIKGVDPYTQFPDLVQHSYFGQTGYKFNKHFSFAALSSQTERQLKSAGTFLPSFSYHYYVMDDKTELTGQNSSQKSKNLEMLLSAAYYYTYVINHNFYLNAGLMPGMGLITTKLYTRLPSETLITHYSNPVYRLEGTIALGYNSERFFMGSQLIASDVSYKQNKSSNVVANNRFIYQIFLGYRFKGPKPLKNIVDETEKKASGMLKN